MRFVFLLIAAGCLGISAGITIERHRAERPQPAAVAFPEKHYRTYFYDFDNSKRGYWNLCLDDACPIHRYNL